MVAKGEGRCFTVVGKVESHAGNPFAVVALNAQGDGRVRSHFERLCPEEWLVRATAEARPARLAAAKTRRSLGLETSAEDDVAAAVALSLAEADEAFLARGSGK